MVGVSEGSSMPGLGLGYAGHCLPFPEAQGGGWKQRQKRQCWLTVSLFISRAEVVGKERIEDEGPPLLLASLESPPLFDTGPAFVFRSAPDSSMEEKVVSMISINKVEAGHAVQGGACVWCGPGFSPQRQTK